LDPLHKWGTLRTFGVRSVHSAVYPNVREASGQNIGIEARVKTEMNEIYGIDWKSIFVPSFPQIGEILLRGTIVYLFIFFVFRLLRRESGELGISDLIVVVLIADAAQNAMAAEYKTVTEGLVLVVTLAFWDYFLDWLSYRFLFFRRLLRPTPILLVKDGRLQRRNLRKEMISEDEMMRILREQGVERVEAVKRSYMEDDGTVSVIKKE
jgi:uncharacterized membrane protein YcaP (DUF421 family)